MDLVEVRLCVPVSRCALNSSSWQRRSVVRIHFVIVHCGCVRADNCKQIKLGLSTEMSIGKSLHPQTMLLQRLWKTCLLGIQLHHITRQPNFKLEHHADGMQLNML